MNWLRYGEIIKKQFFLGKVYPFVERDEKCLFASKDFFSRIGIDSEEINVEVKFVSLPKEKWYECYLRRSEKPYQLLLSYDELVGLQSKNIFYASPNWYSEFSFPPFPLDLILKIPAEYFLTSKFKS